MTHFFSYKYKKKMSDVFTNWCFDKLKDIPYIEYITILIHSLFIILLTFIVFYCKKQSILFKIALIILILLVLINKYFDACPITRLERKLLKNKKWFGFPYNYIFDLFNIEINKFRVALMFWSICFIYTIFCVYKLVN